MIRSKEDEDDDSSSSQSRSPSPVKKSSKKKKKSSKRSHHRLVDSACSSQFVTLDVTVLFPRMSRDTSKCLKIVFKIASSFF